jgi:DNA-binding CsgD family transcriptional regulator
MRDRSSGEAKVSTARGDPSDCLASFVVDQRSFQVVRCYNKHTRHPAEVARFNLSGLTLAVVENHAPDKSIAEAREIIAKLTGRELQIAAMVAEGYATKNIAYKLRISEWTVATHLRRICAKLHVHNRAAMVYRCASLIKNAAEMAKESSSRCDLHAPGETIVGRAVGNGRPLTLKER